MEKNNSVGVMIDLSRGAVMKAEKIVEFAKLIKRMQYDRLYLYMEDVYTIDGEPYFGYQRGRYSCDELRFIDQECFKIGIEVVPCIQTLAHLERMFKWREYNSIKDIANILLAEEPKTYELIEKMLVTMRKCFRTNSINIGMDEAHNLGLGNYLKKHGYTPKFNILKKHLDKVLELVKKYGYKPTMWSDMFIRLTNENDEYYLSALDEKNLLKAKEFIPNGVTLCYWDYYHKSKKIYDVNFKAHKLLTDDLSFAGGLWSWGNLCPDNKNSQIKTKAALKSMREHQVKSAFFTMWGDDGKECSFFYLIPSLFYAVQCFNGIYKLSEIKKNFSKIFPFSFDLFMKLDLLNNPKENGVSCKSALYNDPLIRLLDKNISASDGDYYKKVTRILSRSVKKAGEYSYLFENLKNLSSVLEIKYSLGAKINKAYEENDEKTLWQITKKDIPLLIKRIEKFHKSFRYLWYEENKPNGFEIHDARLGGLIQRLKNCKETIDDYLNKKTPNVPQLEQTILPFAAPYRYEEIISTCKI